MTRLGREIATGSGPSLEVRGLKVAYRQSDGGERTVVWNVDLDLHPGEVVGLAGESGSGKSTVALAAIGFPSQGMRILNGTSKVGGVDLLGLSADQLRTYWGKRICYVSQDASQALNPSIPIGRQFAQPLRRHLGLSRRELRETQVRLLEAVNLPDPEQALGRLPFQFSGGQQQRIAIAIALACRPEILISRQPGWM
jgi:peptide/nickel transport system ATP-binding protein